jgi:polar amino acid transport system substrate-binding protein
MLATKQSRIIAAVLSVVMALSFMVVFASCSKQSSDDGGDATNELETVTPGKLTVATGEPAWEPWVFDNAPESGKGYESALVYDIAEKLGFAKEDVVWVRTGFDEALKPGEKDYDFNLQQFTITEEREKTFDFSSPYYDAPLAVIVDGEGKFADAKSVTELKDAVFGVPSGDMAGPYIEENIKPSKEVQVFNNLSDVFAALKSGQIDATVQGAVTANYNVNIDNKQMPNAKIVGLLPGSEGADPFGLLLTKDSPLTAKVSEAIDALTADGTIDALKQEYLGDYDFGELTQ